MSRYSSNANATSIKSLPLPLGEGRGEGAFPSGTQPPQALPQTPLGAAHAAPPDVRSGHPGLRSLDTGWRSAILAPLASDTGEPARAAPRGIHLERPKAAKTHLQTAAPNLPLSLGERAGVRVPSPDQQTRAAFTLVELLVVIGILSILAALVTPAIFQARVSARNAAIKAEIDMLHMAIMNYKNEYGSFPPAFDATPLPPASPTASAIMASHILRAFPRTKTSMPDNRPTSDQRLAIFDTSTSTNPTRITNGLVFWLQGFTPDITDPLGVTSSAKRAKLFDFDESRILQVPVGTATRFSYHPADKPGSPYVYLPASQYGALPYAGASNYGAMRQTTSGDSQPFFNAGQGYFNPDTFQILCAGLDEQWGTEDDLSNFWKGTRQDYLDSLE